MSEEHHALISNHHEPSTNALHSLPETQIQHEPEASNATATTVEGLASHRLSQSVPLDRDGNNTAQGQAIANATSGEQHELGDISELKTAGSHSTLTRPRRRRRRLFKIWWLETVACATSLAVLLALLGILYYYKNRPSPDWPKWMSLNTIVSVFIVVLNTSVLLVLAEGIGQLKWSWFTKSSQPLEHVQMWDDATRGPVGAFVLLGRLRGRDLLASLGALIVVLTLIVDPFAQQIIHYKDCAIPIPGSAKLPRANSFHGGGFHIGALSESIVAGVQNAINAGVFDPKPYTSFECGTGNCTWPNEYSSVAWCSTCRDISDQLSITNSSQYTKTITMSNSTGNGTSETEYAGYLLITSVQNGISISVPYGASVASMPLWTYAAMGPAPEDVVSSFSSGSIDFITGAKPPEVCNDTDTAAIWPCTGPLGSRCSFFPCVKTFNASTESGQLTETLIDVSSEWGMAGFGGAMLDVTCLNSSDEIRSLKDKGYKIDNGQRYLAYNLSDPGIRPNYDNPLTSSFIRQNCLYTTDVTWQYSIVAYFRTLLNGTVTGYAPTPVTPPDLFTGPQIVQSFFDFGHATFKSIENTVRNISVSLTNYIRENGEYFLLKNGTEEIYSTPATGITKQYKICIGVRWAWLAYPGTLVLLTLIFFGFLLASTWPRSSGLRIWKSSPLALLYHGLAYWDPEQLDENELKVLDEAEGMKQLAKSTSVKLEGTIEGLVQFVEKRKVFRQLI